MRYLILFLSLITLSCVQKKHSKTITFKLDMSHVEHVSKVGIRGPFTKNPWQETIYLNDENKDGIYEGTITKQTAQNTMPFKFVNQDSVFELEHQDNRFLTFKYQQETIVYEAIFNTINGKQTAIE